MAHNTPFDAKYYSRFYGKGGVHGKRRIADLATSVHHMCKWWGLNVRSVLDVGAGPGFWSNWYRAEHPRVLVHSTDISEHACKKYGHEQRDISEWMPPRAYDLVICHGVLQYPNESATKKAITHLGAATKHVLYLEIPTTDDFVNVVDIATTDMDVHQRSGAWYRRELNKGFQQVGAGLWLSRHSNIPMYELERCASH
jgi:trans-aconitate methyltransferase